MRASLRVRVVAPLFLLGLASVGAVAVVACSTDSAPAATIPGEDSGGGAQDSAVPQNDSGASGNDSGASDAGSANDTGGNVSDAPNQVDAADIPDGGYPVDPGHVQCGPTAAILCAVPSNMCCVSADAGKCQPSNGSCAAGTLAEFKCDEAANCTGGTVCCATASLAQPNLASSCDHACAGFGKFQLCRTNGECPNRDCTPQNCYGAHIEACGGVQPGCTQ
jgi:hypothetical protein